MNRLYAITSWGRTEAGRKLIKEIQESLPPMKKRKLSSRQKWLIERFKEKDVTVSQVAKEKGVSYDRIHHEVHILRIRGLIPDNRYRYITRKIK